MDYKINQRILDQRINELFERGHIDNDIKNITIRKNILNKLYPYQILHTFNMITALKNNQVVIDASYTGTGKTHTTIAACAQLNLIPFIICPKSAIHIWIEVIKLFGIEHISVVNYDLIRCLKYYDKRTNIKNCPYLEKKGNMEYVWNFSSHDKAKNIIMIFDEVHKCKNYKTLNSKLLLACKNFKTIMLSATLCDKDVNFGIFGMMLGFIKILVRAIRNPTSR